MGITFQDMMVRSILVAIALVACVRAVPMPNDIVPETKFVEGAATSAHASAKQVVTEMIQAGSDWTACSELANATRDEVTEAVTDKQDMLDGLDKGCDCAGKGQDEVNRTLNEMNAAFNAVTDAETALETATNAQVQLADQEFSFLQAGECGWIQTDVAYQIALATYNKAVETLATERITYKLSVTAHTEAVTEAARLKLECECATQSAHAVAWADANQDNDANAAARAQAHHIDCVVDHISEADCSFGPAPGLTQPTLCDDIESVSCAAESGSAAPVVVDEPPPPEPPIAALPMNDACTFTPVQETMPFSVSEGVTNLVTQIKAGYRDVYVMLDATADIDLVLQTAGSQTVIVAYDFHSVHYARNWGEASITSPMSIQSCTDSCDSSMETRPYSDGSTYTVSATSSYSNEYIYIAEVTETLNLYVDGHETGSGTVSYGFNCAADCATCNAIAIGQGSTHPH